MAGIAEHIVCPLCFWNTRMEGKKGLVEYRKWKPDSDFIQFRDYAGGRQSGFPKVDVITLHDTATAGNPTYDEALNRMKEQLLIVLGAFYNEGLITSAEIKRVIP